MGDAVHEAFVRMKRQVFVRVMYVACSCPVLVSAMASSVCEASRLPRGNDLTLLNAWLTYALFLFTPFSLSTINPP